MVEYYEDEVIRLMDPCTISLVSHNWRDDLLDGKYYIFPVHVYMMGAFGYHEIIIEQAMYPNL